MPKAEPVWDSLEFPPAPSSRPTVFINMVTTIDGKIITGDRDDDVHDLGSAVDHATMHAIERAAQGVINGASTIRATPVMNLPPAIRRYCVTASGSVDLGHSFFAGQSWLVMPGSAPELPHPSIRTGQAEIDWPETLRIIRQEHGVERLLCEGGSELNASLLECGLVDELFLTLAPKVKLGRGVPTYAGGRPLPRASVMAFELVGCRQVGSELFLRYRRHP